LKVYAIADLTYYSTASLSLQILLNAIAITIVLLAKFWSLKRKMSITIESDLKEILTRLEQKIDNVSKDVNDLKVSVAETRAELKEDIKALNEKVDGLSKRLDTTEFVNRGILIGLIVAILGGFAKLFGIVGNP
jgi:uncharacterized protein YlxW (UPF0749 family)